MQPIAQYGKPYAQFDLRGVDYLTRAGVYVLQVLCFACIAYSLHLEALVGLLTSEVLFLTFVNALFLMFSGARGLALP